MSVLVVKIGGASLEAVSLPPLDDTVLVHGAGPQITAEMQRRGLEPQFVRGRRVTTPAVLDVVRDSMREVNAAICAALGPRAVGLFGDEIGLKARPVPELGLVGEPTPCAPRAIVDALAAGLVPVVAPLAVGPLNVNADEAATALAVGLGAERIVFVTDVAGVLVDEEVLARIDVAEAERLLPSFEGGIVPKLRAAIAAARSGMEVEIGETAVVA